MVDALQKPLSVGVIGAGEIVTHVHLPVLSACEGVRLAYIGDTNPEAARRAAKIYRTQPAIISDLDALPACDVVLLAVPVSARMPYYKLFAGREACVLAEKPLAQSLKTANLVCDLYPEHALACGFQRRSYATARLARTMVAEEWFGQLRGISVSEGALTTKTGTDARFYDSDGSGGVLRDLGCHSLDLALWITGATEVTVAEQRFVFDHGTDREVQAQMLLHTPSGPCEFEYFVTWLRPAENEITLRFDNCVASLSTRPAEHIEIRGWRNKRAVAKLSAADGAGTVYQAFYLEWMAFLEGVRNREASPFSARSALATVAAVDALYQAAELSR
jgi:predicted dehydrogenase